MLHQKTGSSRNLIIYFPDLNIQVLLLHLFPRFIKMLLMVEIILPITATAKFSSSSSSAMMICHHAMRCATDDDESLLLQLSINKEAQIGGASASSYVCVLICRQR